ncbi:MAG: hypothetical protein IPP46_19830 [Bacteroidetes bacterium]|nr:hypothetical protein [Bacteroidota bacterium]
MKEWWAKDPFKESAVIAYYAIFSLPGLLMVILTIAGYFFGQDAVSGRIASQITSTLGPDTAQGGEIIANGSNPEFDVCNDHRNPYYFGGCNRCICRVSEILNSIWGVKRYHEVRFFYV